MNQDVFGTFTEKSRDLLERSVRLNQGLFEQFSKASKMQLESLQRYATFAMEQSRAAGEALKNNDLAGLAQCQTEAFKNLNEQMASDWQAWQGYVQEVGEQLQAAFQGEEEPAAPSKPRANPLKSAGSEA